eukprot:s469_g4.t1
MDVGKILQDQKWMINNQGKFQEYLQEELTFVKEELLLLNDALSAKGGEQLQVGTPEELYSKAQGLGFSLAQTLGWEVKSEGDGPSLLGSLGEGLRGG